MINLAICGITGKMGNAILENITEDNTVTLNAATVKKDNVFYNKKLLELRKHFGVINNDKKNSQNSQNSQSGQSGQNKSSAINDDLIISYSLLDNKDFHVAIDFSTPKATLEYLEQCIKLNKPLVIGTTGFSQIELEKIQQASKTIPVLLAPNMSLGINILYALIEIATKALMSNSRGSNFSDIACDIAISEIHHKHKKDAPSGTALEMGKIITKTIADMNKINEAANTNKSKDIANINKAKEIQYNSLRLANATGEHKVTFATEDERIEITHLSSNRSIFAKGAIAAAKWLAEQDKGLYTMRDVINL